MIYPDVKGTARRVSQMVMEAVGLRFRLSREEQALASHLRGNAPLHEALTELIRARLQARDGIKVPDEPLACKVILERNSELRWLLGRLELLYRSPVNVEAEQGEQPAA